MQPVDIAPGPVNVALRHSKLVTSRRPEGSFRRTSTVAQVPNATNTSTEKIMNFSTVPSLRLRPDFDDSGIPAGIVGTFRTLGMYSSVALWQCGQVIVFPDRSP